MEGGPIRVLVVDDHAMVREGLVAVLGAEKDLEIVGSGDSVAAGESGLRNMRPDVLVSDYQLPDGTGLDLARLVVEEDLAVHVLLISGFDNVDLIEEAVRAGCSGFLGKGRDTFALADAVRSVAQGTAVFPANTLRRIVRVDAPGIGDDLTSREREVLDLLSRPCTVDEIAAELFVSVHTVRNHVRAILQKLHARSQLEAVVFGVRHGLIEIS